MDVTLLEQEAIEQPDCTFQHSIEHEQTNTEFELLEWSLFIEITTIESAASPELSEYDAEQLITISLENINPIWYLLKDRESSNHIYHHLIQCIVQHDTHRLCKFFKIIIE